MLTAAETVSPQARFVSFRPGSNWEGSIGHEYLIHSKWIQKLPTSEPWIEIRNGSAKIYCWKISGQE